MRGDGYNSWADMTLSTFVELRAPEFCAHPDCERGVYRSELCKLHADIADYRAGRMAMRGPVGRA